MGVGAQTVLSSLPRRVAQAEVASLQRAYPRSARLEAYQLEGIEAPTAATAQRMEALVRRDPWHLPSRLTLLRHAIAVGESTRFQAAADAAAALAEHVHGLVQKRAAMPPLAPHVQAAVDSYLQNPAAAEQRTRRVYMDPTLRLDEATAAAVAQQRHAGTRGSFGRAIAAAARGEHDLAKYMQPPPHHTAGVAGRSRL